MRSSSHSLKRASSCPARKWSPSARRPALVWTTCGPLWPAPPSKASVPRRRRGSTSIVCSACTASGPSRRELSGRDRSLLEMRSASSPAGARVRVRSVQVHDRGGRRRRSGPARRSEHSRASTGTSSGRGDALVTPGAYDAELPARRRGRGARDRSRRSVLVHHGTCATLARVVRARPLSRSSGSRTARRGARATGSSSRGQTTLGGGRVIDAAPPRHAEPGAVRARGTRRALDPCSDPGRDGGWILRRRVARGARSGARTAAGRCRPARPGGPGAGGAVARGRAAAARPRAARVAKLYRPGAAGQPRRPRRGGGGARGTARARPVKVDDRALARFLEEQGRLVRVRRRLRDLAAGIRAARAALVGGARVGRHASRSPASATSSAPHARPRSCCWSASTPTASRAASATSAC